MERDVFARFRDLIHETSGIVLSQEKQSLLTSRIQKRLRERGLSSESEYLEIIETDATGYELVQLIDSISTNTTYFWRESDHFRVLGEIFDQWRSAGKSKVLIWCAAASMGQEPYTLAMESIEHLPAPQFEVKILATDVSTRVLDIARAGRYAGKDVSKLPADKRRKFFTELPIETGQLEPDWQVNSEVSNHILFKKLNLIEFPYPMKAPLDIIFCRNVMIYFDVKTRQRIIDECSRILAPGGFLFLSLSESLLGITHSLTKYNTSVYQKQV